MTHNEPLRDAAQWLAHAFALLERARADRRSPMRTFALATAQDGRPQARYVVLRGVDREAHAIQFWTDRRSSKVTQFGEAAALFWSPKASLQLRLDGPVEMAGTEDGEVAQLFDGLPDGALRDYATHAAPGTLTEGDADARGGRELARENFLSCRLVAREADLVHLGSDRHSRFRYGFRPFEAVEVVP